jgi:putative salt-induced outer membrane protein YdiY
MIKPTYIGINCALVVVLTAPHAFSQTPPTTPEPPPRREGGGELALVNTTGNTSTATFGASADFTLRPDPWIFEEKIQFVRSEADDVLKAQAFTQRFRAGRMLTPRLTVFGEHAYLRDVLSGIEHRNTISGGVTFALVRSALQTLDVDGSVGYANEQRVTNDDISTGVIGGGTRYRLKLTANAELADDFAIQEAFHDSSDWRINHFIGVTAKISTIFALKVGNTLRFVNSPPTGFQKRDTITSATIVARFRSQP